LSWKLQKKGNFNAKNLLWFYFLPQEIKLNEKIISLSMQSIRTYFCPKHYELTDHLGNVRVVISDRRFLTDENNDDSYGSNDLLHAEVISASDYYPFGMPSRTYNAQEYRFGFNGMEKDDEWTGTSGSHLDFGARIYDSRIGRWTALDPLAAKYPSLSPYAFVGNSPILFVDLDGREIWINPSDGGKAILYVPNNTSISESQGGFVQVVAETLDYLSSSGQDVNDIINTLASDGSSSTISKADWNVRVYNSGGGNIGWSPEGGVITIEGERQSPSISLIHELGHTYYQKYNPDGNQAPKFTEFEEDIEAFLKATDDFILKENECTKDIGTGGYEEKWVIQEVENPAAKKAGQGIRLTHDFKEKFKAESPTSTEGKAESEF
jgi:RHS repeat-associated protein